MVWLGLPAENKELGCLLHRESHQLHGWGREGPSLRMRWGPILLLDAKKTRACVCVCVCVHVRPTAPANDLVVPLTQTIPHGDRNEHETPKAIYFLFLACL